MQSNLTSIDVSTIRIALMAWINRCERESRTMVELSEDYPVGSELNLKCLANAYASENFVREAQAVLSKL